MFCGDLNRKEIQKRADTHTHTHTHTHDQELPDVQAGFRKGRGTRYQIATICWVIEKVTACQKNIYFCFIDYAKAFDCVDHNKLEHS